MLYLIGNTQNKTSNGLIAWRVELRYVSYTDRCGACGEILLK
jgi:hypothetical protein